MGLGVRIAKELIEQARQSGVSLVGEGRFAGWDHSDGVADGGAEMAEHLGYGRGEVARIGGNHRNGTTSKTVKADVGSVRIEVPRGRAGSFEPEIVPKHVRRVAGFDESIISLYAKGLTTGEIQAHLAEIYDIDVSWKLISRVTDRAHEELNEWQNRPLDKMFPSCLLIAFTSRSVMGRC